MTIDDIKKAGHVTRSSDGSGFKYLDHDGANRVLLRYVGSRHPQHQQIPGDKGAWFSLDELSHDYALGLTPVPEHPVDPWATP